MIYSTKIVNQEENVNKKMIGKYIYNQKNVIGKGFSSIVYLGNQQNTGKIFVNRLKCCRQNNQFEIKQMLQSQIKILKIVNHPNIIKCYDVIQTNNLCYIITEYCEGGNLEKLIKKRKLDQKLAIRFIKNIQQGLQYLKKHYIVHRDIKPANILIKNNICLLADLGFAKFIQGTQFKQKYNVGSPLYMSPQSLKENIYSFQSDIWGLGITFFQMLYNRTPWLCKTEKQLITKMICTELRFPEVIQVSENTKKFIANCLKIKKQNRQININLLKQFRKQTEISQKILKSKLKHVQFQKNKQNINFNKITLDTKSTIKKINNCRLIYKLSSQLFSQKLINQLKNQLSQHIQQLKQYQFTGAIKQVVNQYYKRYYQYTKNRKFYQQTNNFVEDVFKQMEKLTEWGLQLLFDYLLKKKQKNNETKLINCLQQAQNKYTKKELKQMIIQLL